MRITITFSTDNAAFEDSWLEQIEDVLNDAEGQILCIDPERAYRAGHPGTLKREDFTGILRDLNGNAIGSVKVED